MARSTTPKCCWPSTSLRGRAQVRAFDVTGGKTVDFVDGTLLGWGLRNSVGLGESPVGGLWSTENSVDQSFRDGQNITEFNPGDELNYLGNLQDPASLHGGNYGYPACVALWNETDFPNLGALQPGDQYPNTNMSEETDQTCRRDFIAPRLPLQAHGSPLDILFNKHGSEAFVSFHGSCKSLRWRRTIDVPAEIERLTFMALDSSSPPAGYRLASIAFEPSEGSPVAMKSSTTAAVDVLTNRDISQCPNECFRPVGLAWDARERLWMSSDTTGEIFILSHHRGNNKPPAPPKCANNCTAAASPPRTAAAARADIRDSAAAWFGGLVAIVAVALA